MLANRVPLYSCWFSAWPWPCHALPWILQAAVEEPLHDFCNAKQARRIFSLWVPWYSCTIERRGGHPEEQRDAVVAREDQVCHWPLACHHFRAVIRWKAGGASIWGSDILYPSDGCKRTREDICISLLRVFGFSTKHGPTCTPDTRQLPTSKQSDTYVFSQAPPVRGVYALLCPCSRVMSTCFLITP